MQEILKNTLKLSTILIIITFLEKNNSIIYNNNNRLVTKLIGWLPFWLPNGWLFFNIVSKW